MVCRTGDNAQRAGSTRASDTPNWNSAKQDSPYEGYGSLQSRLFVRLALPEMQIHGAALARLALALQ
eukprot:3934685-Pyramimonas_sp.AAC.1